MSCLCRDCLRKMPTRSQSDGAPLRCPHCRSFRVVCHKELDSLTIAHMDCDAFYAAIEKRDNPDLRDRPVIVGGSKRGVVSTACYTARLYGIHSAMPMFKALKACPDATVIPPNMTKYQAVGRQIRKMMRDLTPLVEPLSIDEAFLDLSGTERVHGLSPAQSLAALIKRIEAETEISASIGLSYNKFLAKIASDLDKPRGFAILGREDAVPFLAEQPVSLIWGVGKSLKRTLEEGGIYKIKDLWRYDEHELIARYGSMGRRLHRFSRGQDNRKVDPRAPTKSISSETTFFEDMCQLDALRRTLWPLCETVSRRLKTAGLAGGTVTLKLKTTDFRLISRSRKLLAPTQIAEEIYRESLPLLQKEADGRLFRLIGVGCADLCDAHLADPPDLLDPDKGKRRKVEQTIDKVRDRLGKNSIVKGRAFKGKKLKEPRESPIPRDYSSDS
ncbi:MAG: DNA polymerase IV [Pseudomonadota bacterium]